MWQPEIDSIQEAVYSLDDYLLRTRVDALLASSKCDIDDGETHECLDDLGSNKTTIIGAIITFRYPQAALDLVKFMLSRGASPSAWSCWHIHCGSEPTPVVWQAALRSLPIMSLLIRAGAWMPQARRNTQYPQWTIADMERYIRDFFDSTDCSDTEEADDSDDFGDVNSNKRGCMQAAEEWCRQRERDGRQFEKYMRRVRKAMNTALEERARDRRRGLFLD